MDRAVDAWIRFINEENSTAIADTSKLRLPYVVYGCMLLLSHSAFKSTQWYDVRSRCKDSDLQLLYELLAKHLKVTHIAINEPIPLVNDQDETENVLRAPRDLTTLYGDFGPPACSPSPTQEDFDAAFWVMAKQNDIYQIWAPRWTMFSRGNISEKARLLMLPSVHQAVEQGRADGRGCAAVDLFAGIGYFTFSYLKAGFDQVLCWDLNPWSIMGLKKGATANKWSTTGSGSEINEAGRSTIENGKRLLIFNESNDHATIRVRHLRADLSPIRHVNCGLLPTSRASWKIAMDVLDPELGGWIHVHENFAVKEIGEKAQEVKLAFQSMLDGYVRQVRLEDVHRVKSYAPGVMHCVLDIYIPPNSPN